MTARGTTRMLAILAIILALLLADCRWHLVNPPPAWITGGCI